MYQHTVTAVVEWRDGGLLGYNQLHVAIYTAVEVQLRRCRQHIILVGVVYHHNHLVVVAQTHIFCNLKCEGCPAASVLTYVVTVDEYIGNALHTVELQEHTLALPLLGDEHIA